MSTNWNWKDFGSRVAVVALLVLLVLFWQVVSARTDESVSVFDTFACPTTELMDRFAANGVLPEHEVCTLMNWGTSVGKSEVLRTLKARYVAKLPGKQSRFAGSQQLFAIEVQGRKLFAIRNPSFVSAWVRIVKFGLVLDYPYEFWIKAYWVVVV